MNSWDTSHPEGGTGAERGRKASCRVCISVSLFDKWFSVSREATVATGVLKGIRQEEW